MMTVSPGIFFGAYVPNNMYTIDEIGFISFFVGAPLLLVVTNTSSSPQDLQEFLALAAENGGLKIGGAGTWYFFGPNLYKLNKGK